MSASRTGGADRGPAVLQVDGEDDVDAAPARVSGYAEDLLQVALVKTYRSWSKIDDRAALDAYVRRAMVNTHISWWRRRRLAATLGISLGTVKSTVSRAVARLRIDAEFGKDSGA